MSMEILQALKFVQGSVAKKDFVPALTHFKISGGRIQGYNGNVSLSCPIPLDLDVTPNAMKFIKAIETCKVETAISVTATKRLSIKSGTFKAFVECTDEAFPEVLPEGSVIQLENGLLGHLKKLQPLIAVDASRPWATGILFRGSSAFVTNNVIVAEQWLGYPFPVEVNIPAVTIREILRIKEEPISIQVNNTSITFHYSNNRWLRSQLTPLGWPDLTPLFNRESSPIRPPEGFYDGLRDLVPFVDELFRVFLKDGYACTEEGETSGARVDIPGLKASGCFNINQLLLLESNITNIDLSMYPQPCMFYGENFRGAIAGIRQ